MNVLDNTLDFFVRSFKVKSKELSREDAMRLGGELGRFFAVELVYRGAPVRLIVCASAVPVMLESTFPKALEAKAVQ